ncbi:MAG: nucleotidyltransferase family protein, partial [Acidobacteriota bacterium]|nr:nucleotidyltransferase family protein [Acidobacteriota bacterium]
MPNTPQYVSALLSTLHFREPRPEGVRTLDRAEWEQLLIFSDRGHLTLIFSRRCWQYLPTKVQERIARNLVDHAVRLENLRENYRQIAEALARSNAEHLVLKGFSQWPDFVPDIQLRMQSDLDLYCPGSSLFRARDALLQMGYAFDATPEIDESDHLPGLVRAGQWRWKGNAFDPEMLPRVELHYRLWNEPHTCLGPISFGQFWERRVRRRVGSISF